MTDQIFEPINLKGVFKAKYPDLSGKNWITQIDPEDRQVFSRIGFAASQYGRKGGKVRAATAQRDKNGRFI